jgi:hypothetical protein
MDNTAQPIQFLPENDFKPMESASIRYHPMSNAFSRCEQYNAATLLENYPALPE